MAKFEIRDVQVEGSDKTEKRPVNTETGRVMFSKSQAATVIFREESENQDAEGSLRKRFMARVMDELQMGSSGANTYYYNEVNQSKGEYKYKHNKASALRKKEREAEQTTEEVTDQQVEQTQDESGEVHRWQVVLKDTRELLDSFTTRKAAQSFNKEQKAAGVETVMVDGEKKVA